MDSNLRFICSLFVVGRLQGCYESTLELVQSWMSELSNAFTLYPSIEARPGGCVSLLQRLRNFMLALQLKSDVDMLLRLKLSTFDQTARLGSVLKP